MTDVLRTQLRRALMTGLASLLVACSASRPPAPVEDRSASRAVRPVAEAPKPAASAAAPATAPVELKPGTYVVKPGDTLMRIALENGQGWRDIARWNGIENPNLIEVGQVLRVAPEGQAVAAKPVTAPKVEAKPLPAAASAPATSAAVVAAASAPPLAPLPKEADDDIPWGWPAAGPVISAFDESRSKGLGIGGRAGDPVLAAADGRVVYAGSGLRGYGNLVIVKHNATYLTAYAHNQTLVVKEDQAVRKGQKIAEMGNTDAERVQLHFEIRRQGKPIDPARLLPTR